MAVSPMAVVFDFDGLLMDTESTSIASWEFEWRQWGLTLDRDSFFVPHGGDVTAHRYDALAAAVGPRYDREISHQRRTAYRDRLNAGLRLARGMGEWIGGARQAGLRLAVASSSPLSWVERHLRQADVWDAFQVVAGGDEVEFPKPAPDVYRLALQRLGLAPSCCVAVEDTAHGVAAAQAAGLACIAIPNRFTGPDRVSQADLVLASAAGAALPGALSLALARSRARQQLA